MEVVSHNYAFSNPTADLGQLLQARARAHRYHLSLSSIVSSVPTMSPQLDSTPPSRQDEWAHDTPRISFDDQSTGSEYSPSVASVHTAIVLGREQPNHFRMVSPGTLASATFPPSDHGDDPSPFLGPPTFTSPFSTSGAPLSPTIVSYPDSADDSDDAGTASGDDGQRSVYGPKMTLISPPPWSPMEAHDAQVMRRASEDAKANRSPTMFSLRKDSGGSRMPTTPTKAAAAVSAGLRNLVHSRNNAVTPEPTDPDMSFLDLAADRGSPSRRRRTSTDQGGKRKASLGNVVAMPWSRPAAPLPPLPPPSPARSRRPTMPSSTGSTASIPTVSSIAHGGDALSTPSISMASLASNSNSPIPFPTAQAPPTAAFGLISLDAARGKEQERQRAARLPPSPPAEVPAPRLRGKRSGFLRLFKKGDDETYVHPLPTPPLSAGNSSPESLRTATSPVRADPISVPPFPIPPFAAPTVTFTSAVPTPTVTTPRFRERGLAPSLSLRPVSMAFSNAIPAAYLDTSTSPLDAPPSPFLPTVDGRSTTSSVRSPSASSASLRSPSASSIGSDATGSELASVDEQVAAAKAAWQRQLAGLEDQVRALSAEVESLRRPAAGVAAKMVRRRGRLTFDERS
jgi:hypothetical protein